MVFIAALLFAGISMASLMAAPVGLAEDQPMAIFQPDWNMSYEEVLAFGGDRFEEEEPPHGQKNDRMIAAKEPYVEIFGLSGCLSFYFTGDKLTQTFYSFAWPVQSS